ncbi:hypothetical protein EJ08DRAFT_659431 [Tothia fuscella]|uniref:Uncharacterized protein n=1 Tax=Tothia fuscella TaxID=1048955 RepID=A0A9P4U0M1_9PEZI|nr:hypothetical protein EJ08DRAFT_659431 [Tothia fuscella]
MGDWKDMLGVLSHSANWIAAFDGMPKRRDLKLTHCSVSVSSNSPNNISLERLRNWARNTNGTRNCVNKKGVWRRAMLAYFFTNLFSKAFKVLVIIKSCYNHDIETRDHPKLPTSPPSTGITDTVTAEIASTLEAKPFPFLQLPAELRNTIYRYCLDWNEGIDHAKRLHEDFRGLHSCYCKCVKGDSDDRRCDLFDKPDTLTSYIYTPSILLLSRQVHREATHILHKKPLVMDFDLRSGTCSRAIPYIPSIRLQHVIGNGTIKTVQDWMVHSVAKKIMRLEARVPDYFGTLENQGVVQFESFIERLRAEARPQEPWYEMFDEAL